MKRTTAAVTVYLVAALAVAYPAQAYAADDTVNEIVSTLKDSSVYVEPGTAGTTDDTTSDLEASLQNGDHIELVILGTDQAQAVSDPTAFAGQIDRALGGDTILAISLDGKFVGYSTLQPKGVANDTLSRAAVNSNEDPVTTLGTFVRYTHVWQAQHPDAPAARHEAHGHGSLFLILALGFAGLAIGGIGIWRKFFGLSEPDAVKFRSAPERVRNQLEHILDMRKLVQDGQLRESLLSICKDLEKYFRSYTSNPSADASVFEGHLRKLSQVVERYVDIQNEPRYYDDPDKALRDGQTAISGFADYVLKACRSGTRSSLMDYTVNTKILDAQQYR